MSYSDHSRLFYSCFTCGCAADTFPTPNPAVAPDGPVRLELQMTLGF